MIALHSNQLYVFAKKTMILPCICSSCQSQLKVKSLTCENCLTEVTGSYELPVLARLKPNEQDFILHFENIAGASKT